MNLCKHGRSYFESRNLTYVEFMLGIWLVRTVSMAKTEALWFDEMNKPIIAFLVFVERW